MRINPKVLVPNDPSNPLKAILVELHANFEICWYYWEKDDSLPEEDYEPVILVYKDGDLCLLIVRRGWNYRVYRADELFHPPEVLFDTSFHHPYAKLNKRSKFEKKTRGLIKPSSLKPVVIKPKTILPKFRVGAGHISKKLRLRRKNIEDPVDVAERYHKEYCT